MKSTRQLIPFGLLVILLTTFGPLQASAQPATCAAVCAGISGVTDDQVSCMGGGLEAIGYAIYASPACATVDTNDQCTGCYAATSVTDEHCALAYRACVMLDAEAVQQLATMAIAAAAGNSPPPTPPTPPTTTGAPDPAAGATTCTDTDCVCTGGQSCRQDCPSGGCDMACAGGATCAVNCPGGNCDVACAGGADCHLECPGGGCDISCASGAECRLDCPGGGCDITCAVGASCQLTCPGGGCDCSGPGC